MSWSGWRPLLLGLALVGAAVQAAVPARLAWLRGDEIAGVQRNEAHATDAHAWRTPLGSVWKLFVYSYLTSRSESEPAYRCTVGQRSAEDDYCCEPGASVGREEALARSCGRYFEPQRLGISAAQWAHFWREQQAPAWLQHLDTMQPATEVALPELLQALRCIPAPARVAAREALLPLALRDDEVLAALGTGARWKTWSWRIGGERAGGAAGWLVDGTPFWFGAPGTSRSALKAHASWLAGQWAGQGLLSAQSDSAVMGAQPCVDVSFFQRYPIREVRRADGSETTEGPMSGRQRVAFANGTQLPIEAVPALRLGREARGAFISARLPLEDYVARVVEREGRADETAAAQALAVAARSYLLQNAQQQEGCWHIADDSRTQRVSPNPPSDGARAAASFTQGLVLTGMPVRYHLDRASAGVLSWQSAVESSRRGASFVAILTQAYPRANFTGTQSATECEPLPQARDWLMQRQLRWRDLLRAQPGYQPLGEPPQVCQLTMGVPYSDQRRLIIHVREWQTREGRVSLIHEFLHLAFRFHPNGQDEAFIEHLAQRLADT